MKERLGMCTYCGEVGRARNLTPLYEKGKELVLFYCPRCLPTVKENMKTITGRHLYTWGRKGDLRYFKE